MLVVRVVEPALVAPGADVAEEVSADVDVVVGPHGGHPLPLGEGALRVHPGEILLRSQ